MAILRRALRLSQAAAPSPPATSPAVWTLASRKLGLQRPQRTSRRGRAKGVAQLNIWADTQVKHSARQTPVPGQIPTSRRGSDGAGRRCRTRRGPTAACPGGCPRPWQLPRPGPRLHRPGACSCLGRGLQGRCPKLPGQLPPPLSRGAAWRPACAQGVGIRFW